MHLALKKVAARFGVSVEQVSAMLTLYSPTAIGLSIPDFNRSRDLRLRRLLLMRGGDVRHARPNIVDGVAQNGNVAFDQPVSA
jgi:hypothetical protein